MVAKNTVKKCLEAKSSFAEFSSDDLASRIADCAYYKAKKRGFLSHYEQEDWYEMGKGYSGQYFIYIPRVRHKP